MMNDILSNKPIDTPLNVVITSINIMMLTNQIATIRDLKSTILKICWNSNNKYKASTIVEAYKIEKSKNNTQIDLNRALQLIYNSLEYGAITDFDYCYALINCCLMHPSIMERIHKELQKRNINHWQVLADAKKSNFYY